MAIIPTPVPTPKQTVYPKPVLSSIPYGPVYTGPQSVLETTTSSVPPVQYSMPQTQKSTSSLSVQDYAKQQADRAAQERASTLANIQSRLDESRRLAGEKRNQAKSNLDYITSTISQRYPQLINQVNEKKTSALGDLATQERTTADQYARADAQARRVSENAALENRMAARAGNRLGSSFYNDIQARNKENLASGLGTSDLEKIAKMSEIGKQKTETTRYFDQAAQDLEQSRMDAERQAYQEYQQALGIADQLDRAGLLDYGESAAQAEQNLNSRLSQIDSFVQNIMLQKNQIDAATSNANSALSGYTVNPSLTQALGQNSGLSGLQNIQGQVMQLPQQQQANLFMTGTRQPTLDELLAGVQSGGLQLLNR